MSYLAFINSKKLAPNQCLEDQIVPGRLPYEEWLKSQGSFSQLKIEPKRCSNRFGKTLE